MCPVSLGVRQRLFPVAWEPCYHVIVIKSFKNLATEDIFYGRSTKRSRKLLPTKLWKTASRKLDQLDSVVSLDELRVPPGNMFELLTGDRKGEYSIRINKQYRMCFRWDKHAPAEVEITDYH